MTTKASGKVTITYNGNDLGPVDCTEFSTRFAESISKFPTWTTSISGKFSGSFYFDRVRARIADAPSKNGWWIKPTISQDRLRGVWAHEGIYTLLSFFPAIPVRDNNLMFTNETTINFVKDTDSQYDALAWIEHGE